MASPLTERWDSARRNATGAMVSSNRNWLLVALAGIVAFVLLPDRDMYVAGRGTSRLPLREPRVEADLEDLEQLSLVDGIEARSLGFGVRIVDAEAKIDVRLRPEHREAPEPAIGQRYDDVRGVNAIDEVGSEVLEREEIVCGDWEVLPKAKLEAILEDLLEP